MLCGITTLVKQFSFNYSTCFQMFLFCNFCFLMFILYFAYCSLLAFLLQMWSERKETQFNIKMTFTSFYWTTLSRLYQVNFLPYLWEDFSYLLLSKMTSDPIFSKSLGPYHSLFFKSALLFFMDELWYSDLFLYYFSVTSNTMLETFNTDFRYFYFASPVLEHKNKEISK